LSGIGPVLQRALKELSKSLTNSSFSGYAIESSL
jgi:hypothetical protein